MSSVATGPGVGALDGLGAEVDLLAEVDGGTARSLIGRAPGPELLALLPEFEPERPGARKLPDARLAVHVPLGDGRAHLWQVRDGDVALPHLIRSLVRASRQIARPGAAPVEASAAPRWFLPFFESLRVLPRHLKARRLTALERLGAATGWTGLAFVGIRRGRARKIHRLSPTADLRRDSIRIFVNRMIAAEREVLAFDAARGGDDLPEVDGTDAGPDLALYCEEHRIDGFVIARPRGDGLALYVEGTPPPAEVAEARAALAIAFPSRTRSSTGLLSRAALLAALIGLGIFLAWPVRFEVTAPGELRPATSRVEIAAEDARLVAVETSVGQDVSEGDILVRLESETLAEARDEAALNQLLEGLSAQEALAAGEYARYQLAQQRQEIAALRSARLEERLETLTVRAARDGRVADLIDRGEIGAQLSAGTPVAELQVGDGMQARLRLAAIDAPLASAGVEGQFLLRGAGGRAWPLRLVEEPVATVQGADGETVLIVLAEITEPTPELFKGLSGIARLDLGEAPRIQVLLRPLAEWLRLTAWQRLGLRL
ncbi:hypothetical protein [Roseobacter sp. HKCCA0434]|uniref:hypothetical protein n=1 Tax=Roseobacter sp. HKCCA0434 TaxID=3079297 RepID=UPI002905D7EE|nr:hypothetical protein [Roseobacter sp. HKCCA0434]